MKKIQFMLALWAAKGSQLILKLLGRNATYFPGKVAVRICKDFLRHINQPKTVIAVTGTNGKTTVSNLLTSVLRENGYSVTNNSFGSNVQAGVISALAEDTTIFGKPKKDIAVLEVDERSSLLVYPDLQPDYMVCNNIMRDSLKRNAHTEFISYIITKALPASTKLILNADDLICARLGSDANKRVYFGLDCEIPEEIKPQHIRDIVYCPVCGSPLETDYVRYNHIGRHHCSSCDLASPVPDYSVTNVDRENNTFTLKCHTGEYIFTLINDNIVNIYNFSAVIAILSEIGLTMEQISKGFRAGKIVKTRYDEVVSGPLSITMLMAKGQNPIACARCYDYAASVPGSDKCLILIVDDKDDNIGNSESTCWLYDCDYSALADKSINQIIFGGPRCRDHYLRALLAGVDESKIKTTESSAGAAQLFDPNISKKVLVLYELYRAADAEKVKQDLILCGNQEVQ